jgi:transposase
MTRAYSIAFKQKMINRLTGRDAVSAHQLAKDTGIRQQNLSRWLREARNLPLMEANNQVVFTWTVEQKARLLADASKLTGEALTAHLECEGVTFAEFEQWRLALEEGGRSSTATTKRIRKLERELARKEKALAEAAALLVLKKTVESIYYDEDDDIDGKNAR